MKLFLDLLYIFQLYEIIFNILDSDIENNFFSILILAQK